MARRADLTVAEREAIYASKQAGKTLGEIGRELSCSRACVRKWWRIGRKHGLTGLRHERPRPPGALSQFDPAVAEQAVYWKQRYPKRGPTRILALLHTDPVLDGLALPQRSTLASFYHTQHPDLLQPHQPRPPAPPQAHAVHELWQIDSKEGLHLADGTIATVWTVREPVAYVYLAAYAHAVQTERGWRKLSLREIQADLRRVFTAYGLPHGLQTDREAVYGRPAAEAFPTLFSLWLAGLGIEHHSIRPHRPTDQAEVERQHRTIFDWLTEPEPSPHLLALQTGLAQALGQHNGSLPSTAGDCHGRPPLDAHPEVLHPLRPYQPTVELDLFDLAHVDRFLARFTWSYQVSKVGQFRIADQQYSVGQPYAGQRIDVRFDPGTRHFRFCDGQTGREIKSSPARGLDTATITGLEVPPTPSDQPIQLSFPL
jgi:hypothetical protein